MSAQSAGSTGRPGRAGQPVRVDGISAPTTGRSEQPGEQAGPAGSGLGPASQRKRQAILAAAERVFLRAGYLGTNMDGVAAEAQVAKQTVYKHFGSKESLFVTLVSAMTDHASDDVEADIELLPPGQSAQAVLVDYAERQLAVVLTPRLLQLRRLVIGEVERFPDLAGALFEHGPARAIAVLTRILEALTARGELDMADPGEAATQLNWLIMGAPLNEAMLLGDSAILSPSGQRAQARSAVELFLAAYASREPAETSRQ